MAHLLWFPDFIHCSQWHRAFVYKLYLRASNNLWPILFLCILQLCGRDAWRRCLLYLYPYHNINLKKCKEVFRMNICAGDSKKEVSEKRNMRSPQKQQNMPWISDCIILSEILLQIFTVCDIIHDGYRSIHTIKFAWNCSTRMIPVSFPRRRADNKLR